MEYTEEMYNEDLVISKWIYYRFFNTTINKNYYFDLINASVFRLARARQSYSPEQGKYISLAVKAGYREMLLVCSRLINKAIKYKVISIDSSISKDEENTTVADCIATECDFDSKLSLELLQNRCREIYNSFKSKPLKIASEYYICGLTQSEIAKKMGVSRQRIEQLVNKFRKVAREKLKEDYLN